MGRLHELFEQQGQSPWLDNLRRGWIASGEMQEWLDKGVRGLTSNPSIFAKAMMETSDYDTDLETRVKAGDSVEEAYWSLVVDDIGQALELLRPIHEASNGEDGYVSVEVSPRLATDEAGTVAAARELDTIIDASNVYIKVPATVEGVGAIQTLVSEGRSINVTLIFSLSRYQAVIDAYLNGLEAFDGDLSTVSSVASFFISRVDVEVDKRLTALGTDEAVALKGQAAIAQGVLAYELFQKNFVGERWDALLARGARYQRPLWASTGTKDPSYSDTLYIDTLIGPNTVNTIPDATLLAFADHGTVARTVDLDVAGAHAVIAQLGALGIDLEEIALQLEAEGVDSFAKAFDDVLATLGQRAAEFSTD